MAQANIKCPVFEEASSYEAFEVKVKAWLEVTSLPVEKRGIHLTLGMVEKSEEVFGNVTLEEMKGEEGVNNVLKYLKKAYGKDEMTDTLDKYENYRMLSRTAGQSINAFCTEFEKRVKDIENKGIKFPEEVKAFDLLRSAKITREEKKLVLTGIDYSKKTDIFKNALSSLKKFLGEAYCGNVVDNSIVKVEDTFYTNRGGFRGRRSGMYGRYRGFGGRFRGVNRGRGENGSNVTLNPMGPDGKRLKCFGCGSINHLRNMCPNPNKMYSVRYTKDEKAENTDDSVSENFLGNDHIVLFTGYNKSKISELSVEAAGGAILDSACSSNVAGLHWYDNFLSLINAREKDIIKSKSSKHFRFGDGPPIESVFQVKLPAEYGGKRVMMDVDIVKADIPFLLSKNEMKKQNMILDLTNDCVMINGKSIFLEEADSGHYILPLINNCEKVKTNTVYFLGVYSEGKTTRQILDKLHKQFGHPTVRRLRNLIIDAKLWKAEYLGILEDINAKCKVCHTYKKTPMRSVVSLRMGDFFNDVIVMDLKQIKSGYILHIIDSYSRFTRSVIVNRKKSTEILEKLLKEWVAIFGCPRTMLTDNGGEFTSQEMREVASQLNIVKLTTASEAPWQNGLCERVHQVTDMILTKMIDTYPNVDMDILLAWANMARNSLQMYRGFSSHQLVFGVNPNLPNVMYDKVPALEGRTSSQIFANHLNSLNKARELFIQTDASIRLKKAIQRKLVNFKGYYNHGDLVYYKRQGIDRWLGPATVVFQDKKIIFIRHGSEYYRISINRISKAVENDKDQIVGEQMIENTEQNTADQLQETATGVEQLVERDDQQEKANDKKELVVTPEVQIKKKGGGNKKVSTIKNPCSVCSKEVFNSELAVQCDTCSLWCHIECGNIKEEDYAGLMELDNFDFNCPMHNNINRDVEITKYGEEVYVIYVPKSMLKSDKCIEAKNEELNKLQEFGVYEEVDYVGQDCISTKWIITSKNEKVKARLVAKGFQEEALVQKDSPTISRCGMRIMLTIAISKEWVLKTTDIRSAFLQGKTLERDVFIVPPKEANVKENKVWKLRKCLYGLDDASRQFYVSLRDVILGTGCEQCVNDYSFYFLKVDGALAGMIITHVDDFLHAGNDYFEKHVMQAIRNNFEPGSQEENNFSFIGFQVSSTVQGVTLSQNNYIKKLEKKLLRDGVENKDRDLNPEEMKDYRSMVGSINWCVMGTRPDLSFLLNQLSIKLNHATVSDFCIACKAIRRLKSSNIDLLISKMDLSKGDISLYVYTDAAFKNQDEKVRSTMAYVMYIVKDNLYCPIEWRTNKIKRVVHNTLAAEAMALVKGCQDGIFYKKYLEKLIGINVRLKAWCDNKGLVSSISSTKQVQDKLITLEVAGIKEYIQNGELEEVEWIEGANMLANCLTKHKADNSKLIKTFTHNIIE